MGNMCGKSEPQIERTTFSVGKNYREMMNLYSGEGVKRTTSWEAEISRQELALERERFWGSRASGNRRVWLLLRQAVEADNLSAAMILQAGSVSVQNACMTSCIDADGLVYEIPPYVINDPMQFSEDMQMMQQKKKEKPQQVKSIQVKLRSMTTQQDRVLSISNNRTVKDLKERLVQEDNDQNFSKCRLFFSGREMKEEEILMFYGLREGMVIQLLEAKKST